MAKQTIEQLELMLSTKTVQASPALKALYENRLAHIKAEKQRKADHARTNLARWHYKKVQLIGGSK